MKKKIILVLAILFGLMFVNSGLNKLFHYLPVPKDLPDSMVKLDEAFNTIAWIMPLVGIVEVIGGVLVWFKKSRALGAIMIFPIMIGILLTHIFQAPSGIFLAIVFLIVNIVLLFDSKEKLLPIIK